MTFMIFVAITVILVFVMVYRKNTGESVYKYIIKNATNLYDQYAPISFKEVSDKEKEMGQE